MTPLPTPAQPAQSRLFAGTALAFLALMAWDHSGLDLWMAGWFGSPAGFGLESHWLWRDMLHDRIRYLPW